MQSAILFGFSQPLPSVEQQLSVKYNSGNCTFAPYNSLVVCSRCADVSSFVRKIRSGGILATVSLDDGDQVGISDIGTALALPNGLFLENLDRWSVGDPLSSADSIYGVAFMTIYGTSKPEETVSMGDINTLIWSVSILRVRNETRTRSTPWNDTSVEALECALYYCVQSYDTGDVNGTLHENYVTVNESAREQNSWQIRNTGGNGLANTSIATNLAFDGFYSGFLRTDLQLGSGYKVSQTAVNGISS